MFDDTHILITGMGVISAAGSGIEDTLITLASGKREPLSAPTLFESPINKPVFQVASLVASLKDEYDLKGQRTLGLMYQAADEAVSMAGITADKLKGARVGVCLGTTVASQLNDIEFYDNYKSTGKGDLKPVEKFLAGDLSEQVAKRYGLNGPVMSIVNACSSGADAIGVGMSWIRSGLCDIALVGGADELNRVPYAGFNSLGIASPEPCAPFDKNRKGLNLGEGAGLLILESVPSAKRRGIDAKLYAAGFGACADAYHLTAPHPEGRGLRQAIAQALGQAKCKASEITYINAHGTATPENDKVEGRTLLSMFGSDVKVSSTKGYTGHTLGGAGGIEAVFLALALREGFAPLSAGFSEVDDEIGFSPLTEKVSIVGNFGMSTSLAFGGNNAALILGRIK